MHIDPLANASQEELEGEDQDEIAEEDDEAIVESIPCLFGGGVAYSSAEEAYARMNADHGLDFAGVRQSWGLDFYSSIKLLNFLRSLAEQLNGGCAVRSRPPKRGALRARQTRLTEAAASPVLCLWAGPGAAFRRPAR